MSSRLITEHDVRSGVAGDPVVIDAGTTITPSAIDAADRIGLRVIWERGSSDSEESVGGARSRGTAQGADVPVVNLPDGRYTVIVEGGRARITRETNRGSVPLEA